MRLIPELVIVQAAGLVDVESRLMGRECIAQARASAQQLDELARRNGIDPEELRAVAAYAIANSEVNREE